MATTHEIDHAVRSLVDEYRSRCLWFLRVDYYPSNPEEVRQALGWIRRHGDVPGYRRCAEIELWLSQTSNETSAAS